MLIYMHVETIIRGGYLHTTTGGQVSVETCSRQGSPGGQVGIEACTWRGTCCVPLLAH